MLRPVITATTLIALAGSSLAYAQHNFGGGGGFTDDQPRFEQRHRLSAADVSAFADARIAALKAGLQLTPDQARTGRNLSRLFAISFNCASSGCRSAKRAINSLRARLLSDCRSAPTTWPRPVPL